MQPTIVIDLCPLSTSTHRSKIGRYLESLALGLSRLDQQATSDLRILGLLSLELHSNAILTDDFSEIARHPRTPKPRRIDRYRWTYSRRVGLWAAMRHAGAKLVHLGDPGATPLAMQWSRCKRVVTCHDLIPLHRHDKDFSAIDGFGLTDKLILRRRYRSADHIIAVCDATRAELMGILGLQNSRISRVYNGMDTSSWKPIDPGDDRARCNKYALPHHRFVLYVGDLDRRENAEGMIGGLAASVRVGHDLVLAIAGRIQQDRVDSICRLAARAGVDGRLRFLGFVNDADLQALYRCALAHLFVPRLEGFGYTVLEAMASGCPVITTKCGSLAEAAGNAALCVDPDDIEGIGNAICRLASDQQLRSSMIEQGLAQPTRFTCELQALATLDVFRKVLATT